MKTPSHANITGAMTVASELNVHASGKALMRLADGMAKTDPMPDATVTDEERRRLLLAIMLMTHSGDDAPLVAVAKVIASRNMTVQQTYDHNRERARADELDAIMRRQRNAAVIPSSDPFDGDAGGVVSAADLDHEPQPIRAKVTATLCPECGEPMTHEEKQTSEDADGRRFQIESAGWGCGCGYFRADE